MEGNEPIVNPVCTHFGPTVSDRHSWNNFVGFRVSNSDVETVDSVALSIDEELGPNSSHCNCLGSSTNPELEGFFAGGDDDEFLELTVIMGLSEDVLDV